MNAENQTGKLKLTSLDFTRQNDSLTLTYPFNVRFNLTGPVNTVDWLTSTLTLPPTFFRRSILYMFVSIVLLLYCCMLCVMCFSYIVLWWLTVIVTRMNSKISFVTRGRALKAFYASSLPNSLMTITPVAGLG